MEYNSRPVPLTRVLTSLKGVVRVINTEADLSNFNVRGAQIQLHGEVSVREEKLIVVLLGEREPSVLHEVLNLPEPSCIVLCGALPASFDEARFSKSSHALMHVENTSDADKVLIAVTELTAPQRETALRSLISLQRNLSQALSHSVPVKNLLVRLQKLTNAVCLVVDPQGRVTESTGTVPLTQIMEQIRKTEAPAQQVFASGWTGLAIRLELSDEDNFSDDGWLISAARRDGFPDAQESAGVHIVATLIEAARRTQHTARAQEEAIRAAFFDEILAHSPRPEAPEFVNRLAALGFSLEKPLRVIAITGTHQELWSQFDQRETQRSAEEVLESAEIPYLVTARGVTTIFLAQVGLNSLLQTLRGYYEPEGRYLVGIGREVQTIGDIPDSYADTLIAIRTIRAGRHRQSAMTYEQFDFATRVFTSVGLEKMTQYSRKFLTPLIERRALFDALRKYYKVSQNANAAASALKIHPNTLRYPLSKIEELLDIDLDDPAAVASLFLAITSLDLSNMNTTRRVNPQGALLEDDEGVTLSGITALVDQGLLSDASSVGPPNSPDY